MKYLLLIMCIVIAVLLSTLTFIIGSGRIPFREPEVQQAPAVEEDVIEVQRKRTMAMQEMVNTLNEERRNVQAKAAALAEREAEVKLQELSYAGLRAELEDLRNKLNARIIEVQEAEQVNLKRLAELCAKMDAAGAATFLQKMESDRVAIILVNMGERQAAAIMDAAVAEGENGAAQAAEWADCIRRMEGKPKPGQDPQT